MNLVSLGVKLSAQFHDRPQAKLDCELALREIGSALDRLCRHGVVMHLESGPATKLPEFPKLVFHIDSAPNGRVVHSSWELAELGPGWYPTLDQAQHADGVATQMAGRGGVARNGGLVAKEPVTPPDRAAIRARLDAEIAKFKAQRSNGHELE